MVPEHVSFPSSLMVCYRSTGEIRLQPLEWPHSCDYGYHRRGERMMWVRLPSPVRLMADRRRTGAWPSPIHSSARSPLEPSAD